MPPKEKGTSTEPKGRKKVTKTMSNTKTKVVVKNLDADKEDTPNFDSVLGQYEKNRELDAKIVGARLGFALYDFLQCPAPVFGKWNSRTLNHPHVGHIRSSIYNEGCDNKNIKSAFTFIVDPDLIDRLSLTSEDQLNVSLQFVKFLTDKIPKFDSADGHHRFNALMQVADQLKTELAALNTKLEELQDKDDDSEINIKQMSILRHRIDLAERRLKPLGPWLVLFIDKTKCTQAMCERLSENPDKPQFLRTQEEALISSIQNIMIKRNDPMFDLSKLNNEIREAGNAVRTTHNKLGRVFHHPGMVGLLMDLRRFGNHFRPTDIYRVKVLDKMLHFQAGFFTGLVQDMADNLHHFLYDVDSFSLPSEPDVDLLTNSSAMMRFMMAFETRTEWEAKHGANWSMIYNALDRHIRSRQYEAITVDPTYLIPLLEAMDSCYIEQLSRTFPETGLLLLDADYETDAVGYLHALVSTVNSLVENGEMPDAPWVYQISSKIICLSRSPRVYGFTTTPILTASVLTAIVPMLERYPRAIPEISRWLDGMSDYTVMRRAGYSTGDYSSIALARFETAKAWIKESDVIATCSYAIYNARTSYLDALEAELSAYSFLDGPFEEFYATALSAKKAEGRVPVTKNPILASSPTLPYGGIVQNIVDTMKDTLNSDAFDVSRAGDLLGQRLKKIDGAKPLTNSSTPWGSSPDGSYNREFPRIAVASLWEFYMSRHYRNDLLKSPAGHMRIWLNKMLVQYVPAHLVVKIKGQPNAIPWWDGIHITPEPLVDINVTDRRIMAGNLEADLKKDVDAIIHKVSTSRASRLLTDRTPAGETYPFDQSVWFALQNLATALHTNIARTMHRTRHKSSAPFYLDEHTLPPSLVLPSHTTVVTDMDTHPSRNTSGSTLRVPNQSDRTILTSFLTPSTSTPTTKSKGKKDSGGGSKECEDDEEEQVGEDEDDEDGKDHEDDEDDEEEQVGGDGDDENSLDDDFPKPLPGPPLPNTKPPHPLTAKQTDSLIKYRTLEPGKTTTKAMNEARERCSAIREYNTAVTQHRARIRKASSAAKRPREDPTSTHQQRPRKRGRDDDDDDVSTAALIPGHVV